MTDMIATQPEDDNNGLVTSASSSAVDSLVDNLDSTIAKFSDDPSGFPAEMVQVDDSVLRAFAPKGLEDSFQQLHSILFPCLSSNTNNNEAKDSSSMSAAGVLMGPRGCGKSLLLERCLAACQYQCPEAKFRKVVINGIVCRGDDVPAVVYEIIHQLSDLAFQQPQQQQQAENNNNDQQGDLDDTTPRKKKRRKHHLQDDKYLLRMRKATFTSNLALLESSLKMAEVDQIPVLLVLDELDAFVVEGSDRQLLLYYLLDRVATPGSNLCFLGMTTSFTVLSLLEKRIRSRAEGTSKVVHVKPPTSYNDLLDILRYKLQGCHVEKEIMDLIMVSSVVGGGNSSDLDARIRQTMQREFQNGKDVRWYSRVLSSALSLYRYDCFLSPKSTKTPPPFDGEYLLDALSMMGASISSMEVKHSATRQQNLCLVNGVAVDHRLQAILDMSKPQVALLLCARRILSREAQREQEKGAAPLTLERMVQEYEKFRGGSKRKELPLMDAAMQLLERGVFIPSMDHSGGGPLQYHISNSYLTLDPYTLSRLPMHLPLDIERELNEALNKNLLYCDAALREWGRKTN